MRVHPIAALSPAGLALIFRAGLVALAMALPGMGPAAAGQFYLGVHGGPSFTDDDEVSGTTIRYEPGYGYGFAAGYDTDSALRLEFELTGRKTREKQPVSGLSNDTLTSVALLANAYFDIELGSRWTPYLGLGTGMAIFGGGGPSLPTARVAFQLGAGIGYPLAESLTASIDYRVLYADTGTGFLDSTDGDYLNQSVWLGLRYGF